MLYDVKNGQTSVVLRVKLRNSSVSTGAGLTGLTSASTGLKIGTIADNEATSTAYTVAGGTIESITTLGTYVAPTATKCRFKEVDATNHPGLYEVQLADARFAVALAKSLTISFSGATNLAECDVVIPLRTVDPYFAGGLGSLAPANTALSTAQWTNARAAALDNLDVAVSTRLATASYTAAPSAATVAGLVWDIVLAAHAGAGSTGAALASASSAGDPWNTPIPGSYAAGTAGNVLGGKAGYALSAAGLDAINVEAGLNFRQAVAIIAAAVAGTGGDTSGVYKGAGVATNRITFTASAGERTSITLSPPA